MTTHSSILAWKIPVPGVAESDTTARLNNKETLVRKVGRNPWSVTSNHILYSQYYSGSWENHKRLNIGYCTANYYTINP